MNFSYFDRFRADPENWRLGFIYYAKEDPRLVVPKRISGMGLTLNFARPLALPLLLVILLIALAPLESIVGDGFEALVLSGKALTILGLLWLARRTPNPLA